MKESFSSITSNMTNSIYIPFLIRGTAAFLLVFIVPLEFIIRNVIDDSQNTLITDIQAMRTDNLDNFFKFVSLTGTRLMILVALPLFFNCTDTVITFKLSFVSCHALFLYSFVAVLFLEPRPY